jgi:hypothetical protein
MNDATIIAVCEIRIRSTQVPWVHGIYFHLASFSTRMKASRVLTQARPLWKPAGYINGVWVSTSQLGTFDVLNPASGEVIATLVTSYHSIYSEIELKVD